jgi:hypothetical protein
MSNVANASQITQSAAETLNQFISSAIPPLLFIFGGLFIGRLLSLVVNNALNEAEGAGYISSTKFSGVRTVASVGVGAVYVASWALALTSIGVLTPVLQGALVLLVGTGAVAFVLNLHDVYRDLKARFVLRSYESLREGRRVSEGCVEGVVRREGLLGLTVEYEGRDLYVPYRYFLRVL